MAGSKGKFCHGDSPTMADCCLVPQVFNARRYDNDLAPYPSVMGVFEECMKLEAFDKAQSLFEAGSYAEAAAEFERAYEARKFPQFLFNI